MKNCKPFVKWVGGKTQLIKNIEKSLPANFTQKQQVTYIEPFVGGGAVLFWILQNYPNINRAVINDINPDLICAYRVIKESPQGLISLLSQIEKEYFQLTKEEERKQFFLDKREHYNHYCTDPIERTALFIFLNRTCFNGLYRVNKKGLFNVPFGRYTNPKICDEQTILADSELLQRVEILEGDFDQTINFVTTNTLFYLDPPYKPISGTSSFTTYAKENFGDEDQLRLGAFCEKISSRGCDFILSNSDVKNHNPKDDFFDNLYRNFYIQRIQATRMINSKATSRGKVSEILVSNTIY